MNKESTLLILDAFINYALGILCLLYPYVAEIIGVPFVQNSFYPSILGAVLFGIGIALTIEYFRKQLGWVGLGLGGAVAINLVGGTVLIFWLILGNLTIPFRGQVFLWMLAVILVLISSFELVVHVKKMARERL
jgi:cobalamin biosynthesis protein CobD/CbiB